MPAAVDPPMAERRRADDADPSDATSARAAETDPDDPTDTAGAGGAGGALALLAGPWTGSVRVVGGGLGDLRHGLRDVVQAAPPGRANPDAHGAVLVPWPNRLDRGAYRFADVELQVPIDEPRLDNAIHGLGRNRTWDVVEHAASAATVRLVFGDDPGYPFSLEVTVAYRLDEAGLTVTTTARNTGTTSCPFGAGHHPYLSPGAGNIGGATVQIDADTVITTDDRLLPVGREPVVGTVFDLREPMQLGPRQIDQAFTDLRRDSAGRAWARLTGTDGRTVGLWVDEGYPVLQVYTADHARRPGQRRCALAVEPMTCPANALRTGDHLLLLAPGATTTARWGLTLT